MGASDIARDLIGTATKLSALEARTQDVLRYQERIEAKLDNMIDRLARIEANYETLRKSIKNEIMAEIGRELSKAQLLSGAAGEGFAGQTAHLIKRRSRRELIFFVRSFFPQWAII